MVIKVEFRGQILFRYVSNVCPRVGEFVFDAEGPKHYRVLEVEHIVEKVAYAGGLKQTCVRLVVTSWEDN